MSLYNALIRKLRSFSVVVLIGSCRLWLEQLSLCPRSGVTMSCVDRAIHEGPRLVRPSNYQNELGIGFGEYTAEVSRETSDILSERGARLRFSSQHWWSEHVLRLCTHTDVATISGVCPAKAIRMVSYSGCVITVPFFPEFIQLLDDDFVSLTVMTLIVNPKCKTYHRDRYRYVNYGQSVDSVAVSDNSVSVETTSLSDISSSNT